MSIRTPLLQAEREREKQRYRYSYSSRVPIRDSSLPSDVDEDIDHVPFSPTDLDFPPSHPISSLPTSQSSEKDVRILKLKFLVLTFFLIFAMALVLTGGILFIVVIFTAEAVYDPVTPPDYDAVLLTETVMVPMEDGTKISVSIIRPKSTSNSILKSFLPGST
jgi:nitrate reductase NapE component